MRQDIPLAEGAASCDVASWAVGSSSVVLMAVLRAIVSDVVVVGKLLPVLGQMSTRHSTEFSAVGGDNSQLSWYPPQPSTLVVFFQFLPLPSSLKLLRSSALRVMDIPLCVRSRSGQAARPTTRVTVSTRVCSTFGWW